MPADSLDRRRFLAGLAATAAIAADPPRGGDKVALPPLNAPTEKKAAGPPNPLPPGERVGFAVVGLGHLSLDEILPAFGSARSCKLAALVTGDADKGKTIAKQYGLPEKQVYSYKTFDTIKDDPTVQIVYIVLPNGLHHEYTLRTAAANKHVLCEKPMANSALECDEMIAACAKADRKLMVAYRLQYQPHHRACINLIRNGELGAFKLMSADNCQNHGRADDWRTNRKLAGGGALPDIGIYCLNAARYLTGEEPIEIAASTYSTPGDPRFKEVEEACTFRLRFPGGMLASCTTSYGVHESRRLRAMGETAWLDLDPAFPYSGLRLRTSRASGKTEMVTEHLFGDKNQFALEMDHMAECVRQNRKPHTPGEEGRQDQFLIETIYRAAATGRTLTLPAVAGKDVFRGPVPEAG